MSFCEDLIEAGNGLLLASCDPSASPPHGPAHIAGRGSWNTVMGPLRDPYAGRGAIWALRDHGDPSPRRLNVSLAGAFHPLGLRVHGDRLFVVNHAAEASVLEVFAIDSAGAWPMLSHLHLIRHEALTTVNAVEALSPTLLLVTLDHYITRRGSYGVGRALVHFLETALRLPGGKVVLLDISDPSAPRVRIVAPRIPFANGLALYRGLLAVASTARRSVWVYGVTGSTFDDVALEYRQEVSVGFSVDNLSVRGDKLLVAGHPEALRLLAHARRPRELVGDKRAASAVAAIDVGTDGRRIGSTSKVLEDGSGWFSSSSTAVLTAAGRLFVSGLYEDGLLSCNDVRI